MYDEGKKLFLVNANRVRLDFCFLGQHSWGEVLTQSPVLSSWPLKGMLKVQIPAKSLLKDNFCPSCSYVVIFLDISGSKRVLISLARIERI